MRAAVRCSDGRGVERHADESPPRPAPCPVLASEWGRWGRALWKPRLLSSGGIHGWAAAGMWFFLF